MIQSKVYADDLDSLTTMDYAWDRLGGTQILVTGATGMIGSMIVDVLMSKAEEYGFNVVAMSRDDSKVRNLFHCYRDNSYFSSELHDVNVPLSRKYDSIIHCASNTHPKLYSTDPIGTIKTNVIGLNNLLESFESSDGRFVFLSSVEIYGQNRGDVVDFNESYCGYIDSNTIRAGYNESKRVGEALCQAFGSQHGVDFVIPRLSRIYGPTMRLDDSKALSQFIMNAVRKEDIVLKSDGGQIFSYCYVSDAVSAILHLFFKGACGEAYNVAGPGNNISLAELASELAVIAGTDVVFKKPDLGEARGYSKATRATLDTSKIQMTGWSPRIEIRDGLNRTVSSLVSRI